MMLLKRMAEPPRMRNRCNGVVQEGVGKGITSRGGVRRGTATATPPDRSEHEAIAVERHTERLILERDLHRSEAYVVRVGAGALARLDGESVGRRRRHGEGRTRWARTGPA